MDKRLIYRNLLITNQAERLIDKCNEENIQLCLLKGAALLQDGVYKIWERDMEDIDIHGTACNMPVFLRYNFAESRDDPGGEAPSRWVCLCVIGDYPQSDR